MFVIICIAQKELKYFKIKSNLENANMIMHSKNLSLYKYTILNKK